MNKVEIINYIKENNGVEIAVLQKQFSLTYKDAKSIIDELLSNGDIVYANGVRYNYVERESNIGHNNGVSVNDQDEDSEQKIAAQRRAYFEKRRRELIKRMQAEIDEDDDEEDDDSAKLDFDSDNEDNEDNEEGKAYDRNISRFFRSDSDENKREDVSGQTDSAERKAVLQNIANVLSKITDKKETPVSAEILPAYYLWPDEQKFGEVVMERIVRLIMSDKNMGQKGAVKKAENYLEAVRDTHDRKMVQIYERLVYELKNTSVYIYNQLKKRFFADGT